MDHSDNPKPVSSAIPPNIGASLANFRTAANLRQSAIADKTGVDQSKISRIENGEVMPSLTEVKSYLKALPTKEARAYLNYLEKQWRVLPRPAAGNPELEAIWQAEQQLQILDAFEHKRNPTQPVRAECEMHRQSLRASAEFLTRQDHQIAFVGSIGVGKTTALSLAAGLTLSDPSTTLQNKVVLETGSGRTTIGEVRVKSGPKWGLVVEPFSDLEIYQLVGDLSEALKEAKTDITQDRKEIPKELERALRNMAGLPSTTRKGADGMRVRYDGAAELAQKLELEELRSDFASRLKLWSRQTRELWIPGDETAPQRWLRDIFGKINKGLLPDVSLPKRIDVIVPQTLLNQSTFDVGLIDTRGVAETAVRPDIRNSINDPRAVVILCSSFNAAPDQTMIRLIEHVVATGPERMLSERLALLVLPRPGESLQTKDDMGNPVESDADGYDLKHDQVLTVLKPFKADIPIFFFNAVSDDAGALSVHLTDLVHRMRQRQVGRIAETTDAISQLMRNYRVEKANLVRRDVIKTLQVFIDQHPEIGERLNPPYDFLISMLRNHYASTVWATTRRQGLWYNLNVYHAVGEGAAAEAKRRSQASFEGLEEHLNNMLGKKDFRSSHPFLREIFKNVALWKESFVDRVQREATETFRPALQDDITFWEECRERWGQGGGYRQDIGSTFRKWFEEPKREHLHKLLEAKTALAWEQEVLDPLRALCTDSDKD